jgi:type VI secretion system protein ImpK
MAEESKQAFDPDATVKQPAAVDPEATVAQPVLLDPEATVTQPILAPDPEATFTGSKPKGEPDPESTDRRPAFDPDATDRRPAFDPEATVRAPVRPKQKRNPFAPKAPPETIQANLSALGGVNPLVAMANPILAAVPQIRRTLKHPDAAGLRASLKDQIEALEMSAMSAEIDDATVSAAVYALCALLDESAAATPWGQDWIDNGLLKALRGESGGAEGFFAQLERLCAEPEKNADLLEFCYICIALGFEGKYRGAEGGRQALDQVRNQLYGLIARRRPRPEALSERWRTPAAQAAADAALQTAARATAARAAAEAAARDAEATMPPRPAPHWFARLPRRAIWSAVAGIVGASIVLYMLALRLLDEQDRTALTLKPGAPKTVAASAPASAPAAAPAPAASPVAERLARALEKLPVSVRESAGGFALRIADDAQFASGSNQPALALRALLPQIAAALDGVPGAIVVVGYADATPAGSHFASNAELSAARARAAARLMAPKLADPKRLAVEGRGDAEPIAPNDTGAGRAKNRRVELLLKAAN